MDQIASSFKRERWGRFASVFLIVLLLTLVCGSTLISAFYGQHPQRHYLLQADSLIHGHLDIDPAGLTDIAYLDGRAYIPFPPGPALVLLPLVVAFGVDRLNTTLVALALALLTLWAFLRLLGRLDVAPANRVWFAAAFFLGTGYWPALTQGGHVWFFASIVAVAFSVLALEEALGHRRPWLAGLYIGVAFLSRQLTITLVPVVGILLWLDARKRDASMARLLPFGAALSVALAGYLWFNAARFGNPFDTGYAHIQLSGFLQARVARYGLFNLAYVPFNFVHMFLEGWHLGFGGPMSLTPLGVNPFGVSLLAASPFLLLSLWARNHRLVRSAVWFSVGAALIVMLLYYNNGWIQVNSQRFSLDFLPALFLLVIDGTPHVDSKIFKGTVAYAVALNLISLVFLPFMN